MNLRISGEGSIQKQPIPSKQKTIGGQDERIEQVASLLPESVSEAETGLADHDIGLIELQEEVAEQQEAPQANEGAVLVAGPIPEVFQNSMKGVAKDVNSIVRHLFLSITAKQIEKIQKNVAKKMEKERRQEKEWRREEEKRATEASDERRHEEKKYEERRASAKQRETVHSKDDQFAQEQERTHERKDITKS